MSIDSSGTSSSLETNAYYLQGNLLKSMTEYDTYHDAVIDSVTIVTNTYDARGSVDDHHAAGEDDLCLDAQGRLIDELVQSDFDGHCVFESGSRFTKTYDEGQRCAGVTVSQNWGRVAEPLGFHEHVRSER